MLESWSNLITWTFFFPQKILQKQMQNSPLCYIVSLWWIFLTPPEHEINQKQEWPLVWNFRRISSRMQKFLNSGLNKTVSFLTVKIKFNKRKLHLASDNFLAWKSKARVTWPFFNQWERQRRPPLISKASERQGSISNTYTCKEQQKEPVQKNQQSAL